MPAPPATLKAPDNVSVESVTLLTASEVNIPLLAKLAPIAPVR